MYRAIEADEVINNILSNIIGFSLISILARKKIILIRIRIKEKSNPILTELFILAVHRDEEFLV